MANASAEHDCPCGLAELVRCIRAQLEGATEPSPALMAAVARAVGAPSAWVYAIDGGARIQLVGSFGLEPGVAARISSLEMSEPALAARCAWGRPEGFVTSESPEAAGDRVVLEHTGAEALFAVPLVVGDVVHGVLAFATTVALAPSEEKLRHVGTLLGLWLAVESPRSLDALTHDALLRAVVNASPDGLFFLSANRRDVLANPAFEALLGQPLVPGMGLAQKLGVICQPDGRPLSREEPPSARALAGETTKGRELVYVHSDGRRLPVLERAAPVHGADGTLLGAVVTCQDLTTQKELERLREEFAAMVAHDLRNPIQSMLVQLEMMRRTTEGAIRIDNTAIARLERAGLRVAHIASDLLDVTRIDLARVHLELSAVDVGDLIREIVDRNGPLLADHELELRIEPNLPTLVLDTERFERVLTNLLENAVKFSRKGTKILISARSADPGIALAITDHGSGIDPEEIPRLFDRFYQAHRARERHNGLGLGLHIAKGFVEAHGGRITVESVVDRGSTFSVWLPLSPTAPREDASSVAAPGAP